MAVVPSAPVTVPVPVSTRLACANTLMTHRETRASLSRAALTMGAKLSSGSMTGWRNQSLIVLFAG